MKLLIKEYGVIITGLFTAEESNPSTVFSSHIVTRSKKLFWHGCQLESNVFVYLRRAGMYWRGSYTKFSSSSLSILNTYKCHVSNWREHAPCHCCFHVRVLQRRWSPSYRSQSPTGSIFHRPASSMAACCLPCAMFSSLTTDVSSHYECPWQASTKACTAI